MPTSGSTPAFKDIRELHSWIKSQNQKFLVSLKLAFRVTAGPRPELALVGAQTSTLTSYATISAPPGNSTILFTIVPPGASEKSTSTVQCPAPCAHFHAIGLSLWSSWGCETSFRIKVLGDFNRVGCTPPGRTYSFVSKISKTMFPVDLIDTCNSKISYVPCCTD